MSVEQKKIHVSKFDAKQFQEGGIIFIDNMNVFYKLIHGICRHTECPTYIWSLNHPVEFQPINPVFTHQMDLNQVLDGDESFSTAWNRWTRFVDMVHSKKMTLNNNVTFVFDAFENLKHQSEKENDFSTMDKQLINNFIFEKTLSLCQHYKSLFVFHITTSSEPMKPHARFSTRWIVLNGSICEFLQNDFLNKFVTLQELDTIQTVLKTFPLKTFVWDCHLHQLFYA